MVTKREHAWKVPGTTWQRWKVLVKTRGFNVITVRMVARQFRVGPVRPRPATGRARRSGSRVLPLDGGRGVHFEDLTVAHAQGCSFGDTPSYDQSHVR